MKNLLTLHFLFFMLCQSFGQRPIMLDEFVRLDHYCPDDEFATVTALGDRKNFRFIWQHDNSTSATARIPKSLFGKTICVKRICPCGSEKVSCFTIDPAQFRPLIISGKFTDASCNTSQDGKIQLEYDSKLTYRWSTGDRGTSISNLSSGTYSVTATNELGCETTKSFSISEPPPVVPIQIEVTPTRCPNSQDGSAKAVNLSPNIALTWENGSHSIEANNLTTGTHMVQARTVGGACSNFRYSISSPMPPKLTYDIVKPVSCHDDEDAQVKLFVSKNDAKPSFKINFANTDFDVGDNEPIVKPGLKSGTYIVKIQDNNGCLTIAEVLINNPAPVSAILNIPNNNGYAIPCSNNDVASVSITPTGGTGKFTIQWHRNGQLTDTLSSGLSTDLKRGSYFAIVTDANGCSYTSPSFDISAPAPISLRSKNIVKNAFLNHSRIETKGGAGVISLSVPKEQFTVKNKKILVVAKDENGCELNQNMVFTLATYHKTKRHKPLLLCYINSFLKS